MTITAPDWLTRHGGSLKLASDGGTWFVMVEGEPVYSVTERPVADKFGCSIRLTNSGKPIESQSTAPDPAGAVSAGLEDLRKYLGW
jgi:hypothetical protein